MVAYDLDDADSAAYESLHDVLRSFGTFARVTESTWIVKAAASAATVRDYIIEHAELSENDRIFVIQVGSTAAWRNVISYDSWFRAHL